MSLIISLGVLTREDPRDPTSQLYVTWPNLDDPACVQFQDSPHRQPRRTIKGWDRWRQSPAVCAILSYCQVPSEVDRLISQPIDDHLIGLIDNLCVTLHLQQPAPGEGDVGIERAQWLRYWAVRARAEFGAQAYIGFS